MNGLKTENEMGREEIAIEFCTRRVQKITKLERMLHSASLTCISNPQRGIWFAQARSPVSICSLLFHCSKNLIAN